MTNVEKVVKAIQDKKYTITRYPCRASIEIYEADFKRFEGNVVELENATSRTSLKYTLFIADEEDHVQFHNGFSLISDDSMPDVLWFKEPYNRVTILGEFYI
nr:MAG TPA: hypothetical protein [Caudoviricetes sp.]